VPLPFRQDSKKQASIASSSLSELLACGHFQAAAVLAADLLKSEPDPTNHVRIFSLLYTRLACLQLLGLEYEAAQEAKALQDLSAPFYRNRGKHVVPWELRILAIRLHAVGFGDWRRGIMGYYDLAREARFEFQRAPIEQRNEWQDRLYDLGVRVSNALIEVGDLDGALHHLESLPAEAHKHHLLQTRLVLTSLRCGNVEAARRLCTSEDGEADKTQRTLLALCNMAEGSFEEAAALWGDLEKTGPDDERALATQNLALCHVYLGDIIKVGELNKAGVVERAKISRLESSSTDWSTNMVTCMQ